MASGMKPLGGKEADIPCQCRYGDGKLTLPGVNGNASLIESHAEGKSYHADDLVEEVKVSKPRSAPVEIADHDSRMDVKKGSCMAADDLPQESEIEQPGGTLEDLFFFNDEEEDDSDWEPTTHLPTTHLAVNRWFCLNCTMQNMAETTFCFVRYFVWFSGNQWDS
jgi:histone deacetylase 6